MQKVLQRLYAQTYRVVSKSWFFTATLTLFVFNSLWLVLSSNLLPYDEYYHVGIIRFYAQQWSPFINQQPPEMSLYGDITRLSAYLYHYLMSFPYRFFDLFTDSESLIIIGMRLLNVAMVVMGILLFRRLFMQAKVSKPIINVVTLMFIATPIVPVLAAQNNYDNAMFMLTPVVLLLAYRSITNKVSARTLLYLGTVGMITTLVKFNFIVIFGAVAGYVGFVLLYRDGLRVFTALKNSFVLSKRASIIALVAFVFVLGLFFERTGVNLIRYKQVKVDCAKVQSVEVCSQYSPWRRNQNALTKMPDEPLYGGAVTFTHHWATTIMRGYFAIFANIVPDDANVPDPYGHYVFKKLLPLPIIIGYVLLLAGLGALAFRFKKQWEGSLLTRLTLATSIVLITSLWVFNYTFYLKYGRAYAIQARYIIPLVMPLMVLLTSSLVRVTRDTNLRWARYLLLSLGMLYVVSGGVVGWIIKSNDNWYWDNQVVLQVNRTAKSVLKTIIPH